MPKSGLSLRRLLWPLNGGEYPFAYPAFRAKLFATTMLPVELSARICVEAGPQSKHFVSKAPFQKQDAPISGIVQLLGQLTPQMIA